MPKAPSIAVTLTPVLRKATAWVICVGEDDETTDCRMALEYNRSDDNPTKATGGPFTECLDTEYGRIYYIKNSHRWQDECFCRYSVPTGPVKACVPTSTSPEMEYSEKHPFNVTWEQNWGSSFKSNV